MTEHVDNEELEPFSELERRYLITFLLTEELDKEDLYEELDGIAQKLEDEEAGAEDLYNEFEKKITGIYSEKISFPELDSVPSSATLDSLKNRLRLLYFIAELDEDEEWKSELKATADNLKEANEEELVNINDELTLMEEDVVSYFFSEEDEEEHDHEHDHDEEEEEEE